MLPCLHSFCQVCLQRLVKKSSKIKCPICRTLHKLPSNGVEGFLSDTRLAKEIVSKKSGNQHDETPMCGMCESKDRAGCYCMNCNKFLCGACHKSHMQMSMIFGDHVILPPNEATGDAVKPASISPSYKCSDHPGEDLKVYCIKCETVICCNCALYNHQKHSFKPAEKAVNEIRESVQRSRTGVAAKLRQFKANRSVIDGHEQTVTTVPQEMKCQIEKEFQLAMDHLTSRKQVLLTQVDEQFEEYSKQVWANKDKVDTVICSLEGSMNFADRILNGSDDIELAVLGSRAMPQLKSVSKNTWSAEPLDSLSPIVFTPTIPIFEANGSSSVPSPQPGLSKYIDEFGSIDNYGKPTEVKKLSMNIQPMGYDNQQVIEYCRQSQGYGFTGTFQNYTAQTGVHTPNFFHALPYHHAMPQTHVSNNIYLQANASFNVKITGIPMKSYPPPEASATVIKQWHEAATIESFLAKKDDHWKLTFKTSERAHYIVRVKIKIGSKCVVEESKTFAFNL